jgi:hypothetical protein
METKSGLADVFFLAGTARLEPASFVTDQHKNQGLNMRKTQEDL